MPSQHGPAGLLMATTDDLMRRLAALEERQSLDRLNLGRRIDAIGSWGRRGGDEAAQERDLVNRLDPGPLTRVLPGRRGGSRIPDLGSPLLARLQDDSSLPYVTAGRTDPTRGFANVLKDMTFASVAESTTITNVETSCSATNRWNVHYVLNSGTAGSSLVLEQRRRPGVPSWASMSSAALTFDLQFGTAASNMTFYLTSTSNYNITTDIVPSWLTAAIRVFAGTVTAVADFTSVTAYLEIINTAGTVVASGDVEDILNIKDLVRTSRLEASLESPGGTTYDLRLRIDVVKGVTASASRVVEIWVGEPVLSPDEDSVAGTYAPLVGGWVPEQLDGYTDTLGDGMVRGFYQGDERFVLYETGEMSWAPAAGAADVFLTPTTGQLEVDGALSVTGTLKAKMLVPIPWSTLNLGAGVTNELIPSDNALALAFPRITCPWAGSIVGMSYRISTALTAGTLSLRAWVAGSEVWTAHSLTSASPATDEATQAPGTDAFTAGQTIGINAVTNGAFLPTSMDIHVTLWLLVTYDGT